MQSIDKGEINPETAAERIILSRLELLLLVLKSFGFKDNWPSWKTLLADLAMPSIKNHYPDVRHMASEVIGHLYSILGDEL